MQKGELVNLEQRLITEQQDKSDRSEYLVAIEDGSWLRYEHGRWITVDSPANAFRFQSVGAAREVANAFVEAEDVMFSIIPLRGVLRRTNYHPFTA